MDLKSIAVALVLLAVGLWALSGVQRDLEVAGSEGGMATAPSSMLVGEGSLSDRLFRAVRNSEAVPVSPNGGSALRAANMAGGGGALRQDGTFVPVDQVFDGFADANERLTPQVAGHAAIPEGCAIRPPRPEEVVHVLTASTESIRVPVYSFDRSDMNHDVEVRLRHALRGELEEWSRTPLGHLMAFRVQDVAVTERGAPVYLVLQQELDRVLWSLHLSDGARVSHVVMLGGRQSAVANMPSGATVEALRAAELATCGAEMSFPAPEDAVIHRSIAAGSREAEASLAAWQARDRAWNSWVAERFGVTLVNPPVDGNVRAHLAGPVPDSPDQRAVHRPLDKVQMILTPSDHLLIGDGAGRAYSDLVDHYAAEIANAPLETLAPAVVTEPAQ